MCLFNPSLFPVPFPHALTQPHSWIFHPNREFSSARRVRRSTSNCNGPWIGGLYDLRATDRIGNRPCKLCLSPLYSNMKERWGTPSWKESAKVVVKSWPWPLFGELVTWAQLDFDMLFWAWVFTSELIFPLEYNLAIRFWPFLRCK